MHYSHAPATPTTFCSPSPAKTHRYSTNEQVAKGHGAAHHVYLTEVPAQGRVDVSWPTVPKSFGDAPADEEQHVVKSTVKITLRKTGFKWADGLEVLPSEGSSNDLAISVEPGGLYTLVYDDANPPMSDDDKTVIMRLLIEELEAGTAFDKVWSSVHTRVPASTLLSRTESQMVEAVDGGPDGCSWHDWYTPQQPVEQWHSPQDIKEGLRVGGAARLAIYWRALDRSPGGNCDAHTLCYKIDCGGAAHTPSARCREHSNWDGQHHESEFYPATLAKRLPDALQPLLDALAAPDLPLNSECTLLDANSMDSDEYDTEWSSHEIVVYLPRYWSPSTHRYFSAAQRSMVKATFFANDRLAEPLPVELIGAIFEFVFASAAHYIPVKRLHRHCVHGPQW